MGQYEDPSFAVFPGLRIGTITADFHKAGRSALPTERLKSLVRYAIHLGPMCFRCIVARPSGPVAEELLA
jgi:hypothetical protein